MQLNSINFGSFQACTPSDTTLVNCKALFIGAAGNITISKDATTAGVLFAVPAGAIINVMLDQGRVLATGTTATNVVLLA